MTVKLPDVSEFQTGASAPNWGGIKSMNGGAAIIRVGYGNAHLDHMFVSNYTALKANNFSFIGLYHYLVQSQDALSQAKQFCSWVGPPSAVFPGTVFMLDLEEGSGDQSGRANTWLNYVDNFYGLDAMPLNMRSWLYSYPNFIQTTNLGGIFASPRRTWIAAYQSNEPTIGHTLWQCSDGVHGSNITNWPGAGRCDTSIYNGSLAQLSALGWGDTVVSTSFQGEYITGGMFNLADLATKLGYPTNTLLRMTAVHYGTLGDVLGGYVNDVLTGAKPYTAPVPAGAKIWCGS